MNKKAQLPGLLFMFSIVTFVFIWAFWLGGQLSYWGSYVITQSNLSGVEAFFYANLNLVVFLILVVVVALFFSLGGGQD